MKKLLLTAGILLVGTSVVATLISASKVSIIGGASLPTLQYYFSQNAWMACTGILLILVGVWIRKAK